MKSIKNLLISAYKRGNRFINLTAILGILLFIIFIYFISTLQRDTNLAGAFVAFGTFILALVTALHILNSNEQEKRRRKDDLLNEIIEWAVDIAKNGIAPGTPDLSDDKDAAKSWPFLASQFEKLETLQLLRVRSVSIESIAQEIDEDLSISVMGSVENLRNQIKSLFDYKKFMD